MADKRALARGRQLAILPVVLLAVGCSTSTKPLTPPDLSGVGETFSPTVTPIGQSIGVSKILSLDATERSSQLQRIGTVGVTLIRRDFLWEDLEPSPGVFDFEAEDAAVQTRLPVASRRLGFSPTIRRGQPPTAT